MWNKIKTAPKNRFILIRPSRNKDSVDLVKW